MKASIKTILCVITTGFLLSLSPASAQAPALKPVKVASSVPTMTTAALYLMKSLQLDKKHGLDVEYIQMGGASTLMVDAVLSGNAMFATPGTATALQAIRQGANLRVVGAYANNQIAAVIGKAAMQKTGLTAASPIADKIRAMKGLTIGTNPVGATYYQMFRAYLLKFGVDPDKDVRLVAIADTNALVAGIHQGRFDAIVSAAGIVEQAISLGSANMWFAGASGEFPSAEGEVVAVVITRPETIANNKDTLDAYLAALQDALDILNKDRDKAGPVLQKEHFSKITPEVWDLVWAGTKKGFPIKNNFPKAVFDYWVANDPKGADSYKDVVYERITYAPAQAR
jgi:NitT/TauT family transport system substrate-binding protein